MSDEKKESLVKTAKYLEEQALFYAEKRVEHLGNFRPDEKDRLLSNIKVKFSRIRAALEKLDSATYDDPYHQGWSNCLRSLNYPAGSDKYDPKPSLSGLEKLDKHINTQAVDSSVTYLPWAGWQREHDRLMLEEVDRRIEEMCQDYLGNHNDNCNATMEGIEQRIIKRVAEAAKDAIDGINASWRYIDRFIFVAKLKGELK